MIRVITAALLSSLLVAGCYVESLDDREEAAAPNLTEGEKRSRGECNIIDYKGCLDGNITRLEFTVNDVEFEDANDFASRFFEMIPVNENGTELVAGDDYEFVLHTNLNINNFADGFEWIINGGTKSGNLVNGKFKVERLREGTYDIRVQKPISFSIKKKQININEDGSQSTEVVEKTYCAKLSSDINIELYDAERLAATFSEFRLAFTSYECKSTPTNSTIEF